MPEFKKSHGIATANRADRTLRNIVVHPKDKVKDEEKTELIYCVPCKNCSSSYIGETGNKFGLRIKDYKCHQLIDYIGLRVSIARPL